MSKKMKQSALDWLKANKNVFGVKAMTNREKELRQRAADTREEAQALMNDGKQEEAKAKLEEAKVAKSELDNFLALQDDFKGLGAIPEPQTPKGGMNPQEPNEQKPDYKAVFFKALRGKNLNEEETKTLQDFKARLSSGVDEDGGYVIPEDIQTRINELRQSTDDLKQYVNVIPVATNKGSRTLERRADQTPFAPLSEYGNPNAMQEIASPKFDRISYAIEDFAGFLPAYNSILEDTDQNLENYLENWIAKKGKATDNHFILQVLNTFNKTVLKDYTGIKDTLNVDLDPVFLPTTRIYTNQDGFNFLDQLQDGDKRPLLQPDPTNPTQKLLHGYPVVVFSNKTIETDSTTQLGKKLAPFIIGDMAEAVTYWDRKQVSIEMTKVGGEAWRSNTTEFRAIMRLDTSAWDPEAVRYTQIDVTPTPVA